MLQTLNTVTLKMTSLKLKRFLLQFPPNSNFQSSADHHLNWNQALWRLHQLSRWEQTISTVNLPNQRPSVASWHRISYSETFQPINLLGMIIPSTQIADWANFYPSHIKLFSGSVATVRVGGQEFILPKDLLCYNSSFFQAALNSTFMESMWVSPLIERLHSR